MVQTPMTFGDPAEQAQLEALTLSTGEKLLDWLAACRNADSVIAELRRVDVASLNVMLTILGEPVIPALGVAATAAAVNAAAGIIVTVPRLVQQRVAWRIIDMGVPAAAAAPLPPPPALDAAALAAVLAQAVSAAHEDKAVGGWNTSNTEGRKVLYAVGSSAPPPLFPPYVRRPLPQYITAKDCLDLKKQLLAPAPVGEWTSLINIAPHIVAIFVESARTMHVRHHHYVGIGGGTVAVNYTSFAEAGAIATSSFGMDSTAFLRTALADAHYLITAGWQAGAKAQALSIVDAFILAFVAATTAYAGTHGTTADMACILRFFFLDVAANSRFIMAPGAGVAWDVAIFAPLLAWESEERMRRMEAAQTLPTAPKYLRNDDGDRVKVPQQQPQGQRGAARGGGGGGGGVGGGGGGGGIIQPNMQVSWQYARDNPSKTWDPSWCMFQ